MASAPRAWFQPWMRPPSISRPGAFRWSRGSGFLGALSGSFVLDVADREPKKLDRGVVRGEVAAVLDDFSELVVQRLDRVGGVDDLADLGRNSRNGMNRSQAFVQVATVAGYFVPHSEAANASSSTLAASAVAAV